MASYRFRLRRSDFGATPKGSFALRNSSDETIVVGTAPATVGTRVLLTGIIANRVKIKVN